ncbi:SH3 domain-containing protein [Acetobacter papayae]|uniref:SH3 domain-containing protein n=1 Tax=Acetobacter papayae TaxID=1076592 RepID=UPI0011DDD7D9|nr:SH3 domain-containing protein [Acetobacter papayae]
MSLMPKLAIALLATGMFVSAAQAQTMSPAELDRLSAQRQAEIGPRDWGAPVEPAPEAPPVPLKEPVTCMSPRTEFETLYAGPSKHAKKIGVALPQLAVTATTSGEWTRIIRGQGSYAWIPTADVLPWRSTTAKAGTRCSIAGIRPSDGIVVFSYIRALED